MALRSMITIDFLAGLRFEGWRQDSGIDGSVQPGNPNLGIRHSEFSGRMHSEKYSLDWKQKKAEIFSRRATVESQQTLLLQSYMQGQHDQPTTEPKAARGTVQCLLGTGICGSATVSGRQSRAIHLHLKYHECPTGLCLQTEEVSRATTGRAT